MEVAKTDSQYSTDHHASQCKCELLTIITSGFPLFHDTPLHRPAPIGTAIATGGCSQSELVSFT